jgi:DNA-binding GntR family transcriptional regulator
MIYGRVGTVGVVDHHKSALAAITAGDATALADAIRLDIREGMSLIGEALKAEVETVEPRGRRRAGAR